MRYNLTETHIAGIAAGVLAIVIIAGAVVLAMSVAQPPSEGNETGSFTPSSTTTSDLTNTPSQITVTVEPTPTDATPTTTPTSTPKTTSTQTTTSTPPPTETVNTGIKPNKIAVEPLCTNYQADTAQYQIRNKNSKAATITYASAAGNGGGEVTIEGGSSVDVRIPTTTTSGGNSSALTIGVPGTNNGTHSGASYDNAATPCNSDGADSPSITFTNQTTSDGQTVEIKQASLPEGGFVALYTQDGTLVSSSNYIGAGTANGIEITVEQGIQGNVSFVAQIHRDTNANGAFDSSSDEPYTDSSIPFSNPVSDTATVSSS